MGLSHSPSIVTDGLILCLDAANARSYPGTGTTWTDLAGENNGTLINGATFDDENGGVIGFDGANDYISIAGNGAGAAVANTGEFTVMTCVNLDVTSTQDIIEFGSTNNYAVQLIANNGKFAVGAACGGRSHSLRANDSFSTGVWYHLAGSIKTFGDIFLYVNGKSVSGTVGGLGPPVQCLANFDQMTGRYIGQHAGGPGLYLNGKLSGVTMYNRQISHQEVRQNYLATKGRYE